MSDGTCIFIKDILHKVFFSFSDFLRRSRDSARPYSRSCLSFIFLVTQSLFFKMFVSTPQSILPEFEIMFHQIQAVIVAVK